eukprot:UN05889
MWGECDILFIDKGLTGTNTDYMPLPRKGDNSSRNTVMQIWVTYLKDDNNDDPYTNWLNLQENLYDVDSPFYGTKMFHSGTLLSAKVRSNYLTESELLNPDNISKESSGSIQYSILNILLLWVMLILF